jgi:MraZ protein
MGGSGSKWELFPATACNRAAILPGHAAMLLTGTHSRTLDEKKRLTLPKRIREQLGDVAQLFVTPGSDASLWIGSRQELERLSEKLDQAPASDTEARVFRRLFYAQMEAVDVDRAGRILVPDRLLQHAGIQHEAVLLGVRDHLELWDAQRWQDFLSQHHTV